MGSTIRRHNIDGKQFLCAEDVIEDNILTFYYMGQELGFSFERAMMWYKDEVENEGISCEFDKVVERMLSYVDVGDALKDLNL